MLPLATTDPSVRVLLFSPGCHIVGILPDASLQDCFFTPVWFPYSFSCQGGSCLFIAWNNTPLSAHFIVYLVTDLRASGCLQVLRITNQGVTIFCYICVIITFHLVWGTYQRVWQPDDVVRAERLFFPLRYWSWLSVWLYHFKVPSARV